MLTMIFLNRLLWAIFQIYPRQKKQSNIIVRY